MDFLDRAGAAYTMEDEKMEWKERVTRWAADRDLIDGSTPLDQMDKLREEVEELDNAISNWDGGAIIDAIGDIQVVLAVMCAQYGFDIDECREAAWEEIKDRKGRVIDGLFLKDEEP